MEEDAGRGDWRRALDRRGGRGEEDDRAVRLAAACTQVHPELVLRICHAQGRAVALDGDGGDYVFDRCEDYPDGARFGREGWTPS